MLDLNRLLRKGIFLKNCRMKGRLSGTHSVSNPRTLRKAEKPSLVYAREGSLSLTKESFSQSQEKSQTYSSSSFLQGINSSRIGIVLSWIAIPAFSVMKTYKSNVSLNTSKGNILFKTSNPVTSREILI